MKVTTRGATELSYCAGCDGDHIGPRCAPGTSYAQRLRSIRLDTSCTPNRTKHNYYDKEPIKEVFGEDSREAYMEMTKGRGAVAAKDIPKMDADDIDFYLGGDDE